MNRATLLPSFSWSPRRLWCATLAVAGAATAPLGAQDATAPGPVVELPKFVVSDDRLLPQPEAWHYAETPGFEILTNASDKATQRLIKDFAMFRDALDLIWPIPNRGNVTISLILCGKGGKFDAFIPKGKDGGPERAMASLYLKNREQSTIVIDLQSTTLNILSADTANDAATGTDSGQISVDHDKQLYREYVKYLLSKSDAKVPAWLMEGLAQLVMAMKVQKDYIEFGKLEDPNTVSAQAGAIAAMNALTAADDPDGAQIAGAPAEDRDFNAALQRRALVPWPKFFAITSDSPEALNPLGNNIWAKQCYALVHMCLYGENRKYQKAFLTLLSRLSTEPMSEELFKDCFKMDYKKLGITLRGYIDFTNYKAVEGKVKGGTLGGGGPLALREATQAEVGRIKGEALAIAGNVEKARVELGAPYSRGERDPRLLAAIGLFDQANGEPARARKFIEAATTAKVVRPRAYLELARYRYTEALAKPAKGDQFSAEQVAAIIAPLLTARTQPPSLPDVYELLGDTWVRSAAPAKRDDVTFLIEGVRMFPGRLKLLYQTAVLAAQAGMNDAAHPLTDYGIQVAPDAKTKTAFEKLKTQLPPAPPANATPTAPAPKKS